MDSNRMLSDWLQILTEAAAKIQKAGSIKEVSAQLMEVGQRFGFERARFWLVVNDGRTAIGVTQAGSDELEPFTEKQIPVADSPYLREALFSQLPLIFDGLSKGPGYLDSRYVNINFNPPNSEWVCVPLWVSGFCRGMLVLDNVDEPIQLHENERRMLELLGSQATAALAHARYFQREARQQQELSVLNELGRIINNRAALDDLEGLLLEVRDQIGRLINVSNFQVILVDEDANCLEVCLKFQDGRRCKDHHRHDIETGLIGHLISGNRRLFLPCGTRDYR
ncbi:MAG: GAF domain-containing protein, partial [Chloroflexi bacterium]|nr:GAF domain-containing protein [Chloroflexota bacterium]